MVASATAAEAFGLYVLGLLAIGNNISALGAFLAHTQGLSPAQRQRVIGEISLACLAALLLFMLAGRAVLGFFGISISGFQIAGGLVLGRLGFGMLQARANGLGAASASAVVPLAIPLTVGAGTFSAVVLFADQAAATGTSASLLAAIGALVLVNALVFRSCSALIGWLGESGLAVVVRLMGLLTLALGVEFVVRGVSAVVAGLPAR